MADSQGRGVASHLQLQLDSKSKVFGQVFPGALLESITDAAANSNDLKSYGKDDWIVLMAGCNNITHSFEEKDSNYLINTLNSNIKNFTHTNLIVATLPYRYDLHNDDVRNKLIAKINTEIRNLTYNNAHAYLLDLYLLERCYHTHQGYHINRKGKRRISKLLTDIILRKTDTYVSVNQSQFIKSHSIKIIDEDMKNTLRRFRDDPSVAFAHTISGDFGNDKQMTAGVAVKFREEFGRPSAWNCIDDHLAYQQAGNGAGIYSLITKLNYYGKPTQHDYDKAFDQLTMDFKKRNYKSLICSPMGCVRDKVPIKHFIYKIVQFQNETKAHINIITFNQQSRTVLRHGLNHSEFINKLEYYLSLEEKSLSSSGSTSSDTPASSISNEPTDPQSLLDAEQPQSLEISQPSSSLDPAVDVTPNTSCHEASEVVQCSGSESESVSTSEVGDKSTSLGFLESVVV